jgi:hypothetical protein
MFDRARGSHPRHGADLLAEPLGLVDPAMPTQPLAGFETEPGSFERPLFARRITEPVFGVGVGGGWVGEEPIDPGSNWRSRVDGRGGGR